MPNKCIQFLKGRDKIGSPVIIHYQGADGYGTALGGLCSFVVSCFLVSFTCYSLFTWLFFSDFDTEASKTFIVPNQPLMYEIPLNSFIPMIAIKGLDG